MPRNCGTTSAALRLGGEVYRRITGAAKAAPPKRRSYTHMLDRRSEARLMCAEMVGIEWKDEAGKLRKCTGLLEDISVCGACLQLDAPIELGTPLEIAYRKGHLEGSVT